MYKYSYIGPPKDNPEEVKGTKLHKKAISLIDSKKQYGRRNFFNKFRFIKIKFIINKKYFIPRLINFLVYLFEKERISKVHYLPIIVTMDPNSRCLLRCPGCPTGIRHPEMRKKGMATFELMKRYIDGVYRKTIQIQFYNWGESLLNHDLYKACAYATKKGLWTVVHSNLSFRMDNLAKKIIDSKLCNLVVSCDGATQEVYEKYRVGGKLDLVFQNILNIVKEKNRRGSRFPWITAKFLFFEHNWHEMEHFQEMAKAVGADEISFEPGGMGGFYETGIIGTAKIFNLISLKWQGRTPASQPCEEVWKNLYIDFDGGIFPCCLAFRERDLFITPELSLKSTIKQIWNSEKILGVRNFFLKKEKIINLPEICQNCKAVEVFWKTNQKTK